MDKTTVTVGKWMFKRTDPLNWQLFELKEIERGDSKGELGWVKRPNYFGELVNAVVFARNREFDRKGDFATLDAYIEELRREDARFEKAIRKALKEAGL